MRAILLRLSLLLTVALSATAVWSQTRAQVRDLLGDPTRYDRKVVDVEGTIARISFLPDIRNGASVFSFWLADGGRSIRVLNPAAVVLHKGDRVQVDGTFVHFRAASQMKVIADEIDATAGDVRVLQSTYVPFDRSRFRGAVPTAPVDTPWSISVGAASIVSAFFAIVAACSLLLHARRFNLGLAITEHAPVAFQPAAQGQVEATFSLRLISTRAMPPQINASIEVRAGANRITPDRVYLGEERTTTRFPFGIKDEVYLTLVASIPAGLQRELESGYRVILRDQFSGKTFSERFPKRS